jgi:type IV pilus biogenesis protein CpaD/CtpE
MPSHSPLRLPALIVALGIAAAAVSGCASTDQSPREVAANAFTDLRREINAQVADPARRAELLTLTDEFEQLLDEAVASRSETEARIRALNADYDATEAEFVAALAKARESTRARQERLLEIQSRAKGILTAPEWNSLGKFRAIALEAAAELASHRTGENAEGRSQKEAVR